MANKLYVGGVSYSSTEDGLRDFFAQAGNVVSAKIIMDKMTGRSKGFAFVEMGTDEEAQTAMDMLNGKELDGRSLRVSEARPMEERPAGGARSGGFRGGNKSFGGGAQRSNW